MNVVAHLVTLLTCLFAAILTVGAIHHSTDASGRIKLTTLIAGPPLLLLLADIPFLTILTYYLAGFATLIGLIYGLAFLFTAASYGVGTTLRAVVTLYSTDQQRTPPEPPTDQHRTDPPDTPSGETGRRTYPPTTDEHGRPIIFEDQL